MFKSLFKVYAIQRFLKAYRRILDICSKKYLESGYVLFNNQEDIASWLQQAGNTLSAKFEREISWKISPTEEAFSYYCGYWSGIINPYLRNAQDLLNDFQKEQSVYYIQLIDAEIANRKISENIIVVRWIDYHLFGLSFGLQIGQVKKGTILLDRGYLSTSLDLYYHSGYDSSKRDFSRNVLLIIEVPQNTNALYLPPEMNNRDEYELLIARGKKLKVKNIPYRFYRTAIFVTEIIN